MSVNSRSGEILFTTSAFHVFWDWLLKGVTAAMQSAIESMLSGVDNTIAVDVFLGLVFF